MVHSLSILANLCEQFKLTRRPLSKGRVGAQSFEDFDLLIRLLAVARGGEGQDDYEAALGVQLPIVEGG